jgi:hypothetical protein
MRKRERAGGEGEEGRGEERKETRTRKSEQRTINKDKHSKTGGVKRRKERERPCVLIMP